MWKRKSKNQSMKAALLFLWLNSFQNDTTTGSKLTDYNLLKPGIAMVHVKLFYMVNIYMEFQ